MVRRIRRTKEHSDYASRRSQGSSSLLDLVFTILLPIIYHEVSF